ncbi:MAG: cation:proton antiporter regulatory subunit [Sphaerochaetaceae bacterium]|jgi:TrkA domain protein|nr:cation:proton antiporter regulatory subunit [Sphaerochaetaceae bacterium]
MKRGTVVEVKMADLPGVGKKISFKTVEDQKIVIVIHHSGKRDLYFFQDSNEDEADYFLTLTPEETREMGAQLLGVAYHPVDDDEMKILQNQLVMEWIELTPESPFVDKQIAESQIRTHTGASVIAVMHKDDIIVSPDIDTVLRTGDTVMAAGKRDQIRRFDAMAKGELMDGGN